MRKGNILLVILIVVGVMAVLVGGYFYLWPKFRYPTQNIQCIDDNQCPPEYYCYKNPENKDIFYLGGPGKCVKGQRQLQEATPPGDPTTDWKTYINSRFNFQFKYPQNLEVLCVNDSKDSSSCSSTITPETASALSFGNKVGGLQDDIKLFLSVIDNPNHLTNKQFYLQNKWSREWLDAMKETMISGYDAVIISPTWNEFYIYSLNSGNHIVTFQFDSKNSNLIKIYDQILSTFKFL